MNSRPTILSIWALVALWAGTAQASGSVPLSARIEAGMATVDSLRRAVDPQAGLDYTEALLSEAVAAEDREAEMGALRLQSYWYRKFGDTPTAVERGWRAIALAEALRDTTRMCGELYKMGLAVSELGRMAESDSLFRRVGELAEATGDRAYQARAAMAVGRRALTGGDYAAAERDLKTAATITEADSLIHDAALAYNLLGIVYSGRGEIDASRASFEHARDLGLRVDYPYVVMQARTNLGYLENHYGDPSVAAREYRETYLQAKQLGQVDQMIGAGTNYASTLLDIGQTDDAVELIQELLATATEAGYPQRECDAHIHLANALLAQGQDGGAMEHLQTALDLSRTVDYVEGEVRSLRQLAEAQAAQGDLEGALALLADNDERMSRLALVSQYLPLVRTRGELLVEAGRYAEALAVLAPAESRATELEDGSMQLGALAAMADCFRGLGQLDQATDTLVRATQVWEAERSLPSDPAWREQRGSIGKKIYTELAQLLATHPAEDPADARARRSFDLVQRYKARTLWERMMGPGNEVVPVEYSPPDLATLQGDILAEGEVLVDVYLGPTRSMVFAVTPTACRVVEVAASADLTTKLDLYVNLLSDPTADPDAIILPDAGSALGEALLGDLTAELATADRILFLPDGALHLAPLSALAADGGDGVMAAVAQKEIVHVPSVAILARLRQLDPEASAGILAIAGDANPTGQRLTGAWDEVRKLDRSYRGVQTTFGELPTLDQLTGAGVLHVAAHTSVDDQRPWRSGILLAAADGAADPNDASSGIPLRRASGDNGQYLRAADVTGMRLKASLAVLSGCESARGQVISGEGVLGLANAFLSAQVQAVVATLWPVDDRSAADFMGFFYQSLADRRTVAASLRQAQAQMRANEATRHPFHWAAFVVIGDGTQTIPLQARSRISPVWVAALAVPLLLGTATVLRRRPGPAPA